MSRALFLLCLAPVAVASTAHPDAPTAITLSPDSESRWIPFELTPGNQVRFAVTLDGHALTAILDTGVSHSVLSRRSAAVRTERLRAGGTATAIGGTVAIEWIGTDALGFGGLTRTGGGLAVAPLPAAATGSDVAVDLLVGRDLLGGVAIDLDYPARRFRLLPSGRLPFRGSVAPLRISSERQVFESEITISGRRLAPMVVDTGDGSAVTLARDRWAAAAPDGTPTTTTIGYGLAGAIVSDLAIVPAIRLGTLAARETEVRIEPNGGFSASIRTAGRIGSGLLGRYRVLLDAGAGRMVFSPGPDADTPPLRSTSGLLVGQAGDRLRVLHVMRGGPAAAAGWRTGEEICAVDGKPIGASYPTSVLARWSIAPPGTATRLTRCDGGELTLVSRAFY